MRHSLICTCLLLCFGIGLLAAPASKASGSQQPTNESKPSADESKKSPAGGAQADRGEQVFNANCVRCHTPPGGMPQRVTGTIVMHMRVRARLSREDEQALLRFLAP
jgi:cytochrome c5